MFTVCVHCPSCGSRADIAEEQVGKPVRCPACGTSFSTLQVRSSRPRQSESSEPAAAWWEEHAERLGMDRALVLDSTIGGALGGIVVGTLVGGLAAVVRAG